MKVFQIGFNKCGAESVKIKNQKTVDKPRPTRYNNTYTNFAK